ncbi:MAG: ferrochelatase [Candidatus Nanopelagicales bacterium]
MTYTALLLSSFGGPEGPDEVMPFLERVTAGRGVPRERLESVSHHYLALGGVSPINAQNRELIAALESELARRSLGLPVYWGNRNSEPFFEGTLERLYADGHREVLALATSAYSSYSGCRQYREDIGMALESIEPGELTVRKIRPYFDIPGFTEPFADGLVTALDRLAQQGIDPTSTAIFFTTHSVPMSMSQTSGPVELRGEGDEGLGIYPQQHVLAIEQVISTVQAMRAGLVPEWSLVFQSRSGPPTMPWLEPDINDAIREAAARGISAVVVVPIGFVSDHVEVIWDLDHEARETATELGLTFERVSTPGTDARFVSSLVDRIEESLRDEVPEYWKPFCSQDCCPNARAPRPVITGT